MRAYYRGHKRNNCPMYFTLTETDQLIFYFSGLEVGRSHNIMMYNQNGLKDNLRENMNFINERCYVYDDSAFVLCTWIHLILHRDFETSSGNMFNNAMSQCCEYIYWNYKNVKKQLTVKDFPLQIKVRNSAISLLQKMYVFLWNINLCLHGEFQVQQYFKSEPHFLEQYLTILEVTD